MKIEGKLVLFITVVQACCKEAYFRGNYLKYNNRKLN